MINSDLLPSKTSATSIATDCTQGQYWTPHLLKLLLRLLVRIEAKLPKPGPKGYAAISMKALVFHTPSGGRSVMGSPHEDDVQLLIETSRWMQWLDEQERHLIWLHARRVPREDIGRQLGISRSSVWRHWQAAINKLVILLNCAHIPPQLPRSVDKCR